MTPNSDDSNESKKISKRIMNLSEGDIKPSSSKSDVMIQECSFIVPEKPESSCASSSRVANVIRVQTRSDSEASSHMEVDETSQCTEKGNTDIDSGIENMEVSNKNFTSRNKGHSCFLLKCRVKPHN